MCEDITIRQAFFQLVLNLVEQGVTVLNGPFIGYQHVHIDELSGSRLARTHRMKFHPLTFVLIQHPINQIQIFLQQGGVHQSIG